MSGKNRTLICELIQERYIDLSRTTENLKLRSRQKILRNLSRLQWSFFETSRIIIIEVRRFCFFMYQDRWLILHQNFWCFTYLLLLLLQYGLLFLLLLSLWDVGKNPNADAPGCLLLRHRNLCLHVFNIFCTVESWWVIVYSQTLENVWVPE